MTPQIQFFYEIPTQGDQNLQLMCPELFARPTFGALPPPDESVFRPIREDFVCKRLSLPLPSQEGPLGLQPRRSGRQRMSASCLDNLYGNRNPTDAEWMGQREFERLIDDVPAPSQLSNMATEVPPDTPSDEEVHMAKLIQEGGTSLINLLIRNAAIHNIKPSSRPHGEIPDVWNVRDWHFCDLMCFPEAAQKEWKTACEEELELLHKHNVFELTNLPKGCKSIGYRWVFDVKSDGCKKARLVAQGFSQVEGIDFNELFSPVVCFKSLRLVFALAALHDWYMTGVDICTAYLYGKLDEEIYMWQPKGFIARGQESKVICLCRALYSLKQAGLAWQALPGRMNSVHL